MVTTIKIVKCDENSLQLDFNGEIRIFENDQCGRLRQIWEIFARMLCVL